MPEGRGLRLALALVEGVFIKIKTLPYNSLRRCYFRGSDKEEPVKRYIGKHSSFAQTFARTEKVCRKFLGVESAARRVCNYSTLLSALGI
jgi:hypothetical protein